MKIIIIVSLSILTLLIASCSTTYNRNKLTEREVTQKTLTGGQVVKFSEGAVKDAWKCKRVDQESYNWAHERMKGTFSFAGGFTQLITDGTAYIEKNKLKQVNYVEMVIPNVHHVMGISTSEGARAVNTFYVCKTTPAEMTNPF